MSVGPDDEGDAEDGFRESAPGDGAEGGPRATATELAELREELDALRDDVATFEAEVEERTLHRSAVEADLRRYVRRRIRRGHARGWGPYLVLLYGTAMTLGAFFYLTGGWAILAMIVVWLSTLGLYALMLIVGGVFSLLSLPRRAIDRLRNRG